MFSTDAYLLLYLRLFFYTIYRIIRALIFVESDLYTMIRKLIQQQKTGNVEFFNIVARFRLDSTDAAQDHDFLIFNDGFGVIDDLFDPCWTIYTITDRYVYFVRVPDESVFFISVSQRLTTLLHRSADRVARMELTEFIIEAKSTISPPKGRVVMLHSSPCCGASMLGRLLSTTDLSDRKVLVLGEPPVLSALALIVHIVSIETFRSILYASLRFSTRDVEKDEVVVMKTRACCTKIVPVIHAMIPSIQHLYITSRDPIMAIPRLISSTSATIPTFHMVCHLLSYSHFVCDFFTTWRLLEPEMVQKIGPTEPYEFALAQVMGSAISYQRNLKYYALETIYAEDLLNDPLTVARPILDVCGISHAALAEAAEWKRIENVEIESMAIAPLEKSQQARVKLLADYLQQDWCR